MTTRDKLEYQKRLRYLRESRDAKEQLKLAKVAEESELTKRLVTLGDKDNHVPQRGQTSKESNEVPETSVSSRVKNPIKDGEQGDNILDVNLDDLDYARISEQKRYYVKRIGQTDNEPYSGPELEELDIEPQYYRDRREAELVADQLIDLDPHGQSDFDVFTYTEGTKRSNDAKQSLERAKKRRKNTRTKRLKRKSLAQINEKTLKSIIRKYILECACQMKQPFDAPEDEHQGYMLVQSLSKLADQASDLADVANHGDNPEPWVEFKVNSAAEQLDAVHDYIKYGRNSRKDIEHHIEEIRESNVKKLLNTLLEQTPPGSTTPGAGGLIDPWAPTLGQQAAPGQSSIPRPQGRSRTFTEARQLINFLLDPRQPNGPTAHINWLATRPSPQQVENVKRYVGAALRNRIPQLQQLAQATMSQYGPVGLVSTKFNEVLNYVNREAARINGPQQLAQLRSYVQELITLKDQLLALLDAPDAAAPPQPQQTPPTPEPEQTPPSPTPSLVPSTEPSLAVVGQVLQTRWNELNTPGGPTAGRGGADISLFKRNQIEPAAQREAEASVNDIQQSSDIPNFRTIIQQIIEEDRQKLAENLESWRSGSWRNLPREATSVPVLLRIEFYRKRIELLQQLLQRIN